jgi:son of sevenless
MQRYQVPYNLKTVPEVQEFLQAAFEQSRTKNDLQDLYRRSLLVEPKRAVDTAPSTDGRQLFSWASRDKQSNTNTSMEARS